MELFAARTEIETLDQPRLNFDNFFNGFILVFTVLTGENWDGDMI
jgi:hypothetical protein